MFTWNFTMKVSVSFSSMRKPSCLSNTHTYISTGGVSCYTEQEQRGRRSEEEKELEEGKVGGEKKRNVGAQALCLVMAQPERESEREREGRVSLLGSRKSLRRRCDSLTQPSKEDQHCVWTEAVDLSCLIHWLSSEMIRSLINMLEDWFTDWTLVQLEDWTTCCLTWRQILIISRLTGKLIKSNQLINLSVAWLKCFTALSSQLTDLTLDWLSLTDCWESWSTDWNFTDR